MTGRLILWDVDGTLIWTGAATREAFDRAVASVVGRTVDGHGVSLGGKTDPQIALEILAAVGVSHDDARGHLPGVLQAIQHEMTAAADGLREKGSVLPGVLELLERFHARPDVVQSVLTGNLETTGRLKVSLFGLDAYLDLDAGAYGSDNADRRELVPVALGKLRRLRGITVAPDDVWVIGDTVLDLACARAAGSRCLLVATGRVSLDELASAGAEAAMPDLSDVDAVERIILDSA